MKKLETRLKEFSFEVIDNNTDEVVIHKVTYQTNGDLIKSGVYELFCTLYDDFKRKYGRKHV